ncbi:hypothetical protein T02_6641 [Trichinella nativa]|uniref:Uncharacterized protein n=1 Tax=Trichinella nativa TaxID=6335 RepID=A0A0V1KM89_9BILA|nr:hypothetical protein T02_6641 [Trichinella nativa]
MFEKLSSVLVIDGKDQVLPNVTQPEILENLAALGNEFRQYFPWLWCEIPLMQMKTKEQNRLEVGNDLRYVFSSTLPRISQLAKNKQP